MAQLAPPVLPPYLFRYRSLGRNGKFLSREIEAIKRSFIFCSRFTSLNDPMEGFWEPTSKFANKGDYVRTVKALYTKKQMFGIAALSDTHDNELMWTHYADEYRGICIEYYADRLCAQLPAHCTLAHVGYVNEPVQFGVGDKADLREAALHILSQKKSSWAYEREWRVLGPVGRVDILRAPRSRVVRSIYLGSRIERDQKEKIIAEFAGSGIRIRSMKISGYEHSWSRVRKRASAKKVSKLAKSRRRA